MRNVSRRIAGAFGFIGEIFDELSYAEEVWEAYGWGEPMSETLDEAIRAYRQGVEKMNEKVETLAADNTHNYM